MKIGSQAHRERFCRQFIDTHQIFDPATLPWPELSQASLERLRAVPFWQEVLHTERRAGAIVAAFSGTVDDPLVREAVELQGVEETRHAALIGEMIRRYDLPAEEQPPEPLGDDAYAAFADFGYGECLDAFLGFGVFQIARQAEFLPEKLFEIFDRLMLEETRHIVFFINWMAWQQARRGWFVVRLRHLVSLHYYGRAIGRLIGTVRRGQKENDGKDFSATQASIFLEGFTIRRLVEACCAENRRRMAGFHGDLLRPILLPALAGAVLSCWRLMPRRKAA
ncbi:MAG TPA: ferritin-like domain-containing protein [Stellaceae bacterium]|jgi:hypothetical protein|nr:ferritin-like domain-containing protein [Stellaceae bacterium]